MKNDLQGTEKLAQQLIDKKYKYRRLDYLFFIKKNNLRNLLLEFANSRISDLTKENKVLRANSYKRHDNAVMIKIEQFDEENNLITGKEINLPIKKEKLPVEQLFLDKALTKRLKERGFNVLGDLTARGGRHLYFVPEIYPSDIFKIRKALKIYELEI